MICSLCGEAVEGLYDLDLCESCDYLTRRIYFITQARDCLIKNHKDVVINWLEKQKILINDCHRCGLGQFDSDGWQCNAPVDVNKKIICPKKHDCIPTGELKL